MNVKLVRSPHFYRAVTRLAEKAEKLERSIVTAAFVDIGHVTRIRNTTNQYIEGRRGTGKTHLLMYLAADINDRIQDDHTVAVYLDVRELRLESGSEDLSPREDARKIYRQTFVALHRSLQEIHSSRLWHNDIPTNRTAYDHRMAQRSREALARLDSCLRGSPVVLAPPKRTEKSTRAHKKHDASSLWVGVDSAQKVPLSAGYGRKLQHDASTEETVEDAAHYELRISYSEVREAIEAFLDANELMHLYVCIDEWSSVAPATQPYLAEYLKRTLFASPAISVKIAVLPFLAHFAETIDAKQIGFERSGDIFPGLDLDNELVFARHQERSRRMLGDLLFQHLRFLLELDESADSHPPFYDTHDQLVEDVFTDAAFRRLLVFSQGNPRDFLTLFKLAYINFFDSTAQEIGAVHIEAGAKAFGIEKLENLANERAAQQLLDEMIASVLQENKRAWCLVPAKRANERSLQVLVHHRVVHVWDKSYSSPNVPGERFMVVSIDFCIIAEHLKSPKYRGNWTLPFSNEDVAKFTEGERASLASDILSTEKPDKRSIRHIVFDNFPGWQGQFCHSCKNEYDPRHPVVLKAHICPHCAQPLSDEPRPAETS